MIIFGTDTSFSFFLGLYNRNLTQFVTQFVIMFGIMWKIDVKVFPFFRDNKLGQISNEKNLGQFELDFNTNNYIKTDVKVFSFFKNNRLDQ